MHSCGRRPLAAVLKSAPKTNRSALAEAILASRKISDEFLLDPLIDGRKLLASSAPFAANATLCSRVGTCPSTDEKTFQVWPGFIFSVDSRFCIEARARTKGLRHFARTALVAEVPRTSSPRHGPNLIGSAPEAGEPISITVENRSHQYAQNSAFRTLTRESSSDETIP